MRSPRVVLTCLIAGGLVACSPATKDPDDLSAQDIVDAIQNDELRDAALERCTRGGSAPTNEPFKSACEKFNRLEFGRVEGMAHMATDERREALCKRLERLVPVVEPTSVTPKCPGLIPENELDEEF